MITWCEIRFSDLDLEDRIDAEYFQPEFLELAQRLSGKGRELKDLGKLTCSAFYPSATEYYEQGDIPFIRCVDVVNFPVLSINQPFVKLPQEFIEAHNSIRTVMPGDIVITKVGTPCFTTIIHNSVPFAALSRTVLGLVDIDCELVDPYYLVVFLRCNYGFYQLMREREQIIQMQLTLNRVGRIQIFLPPMKIQKEIGSQLKKYHTLIEKSKTKYEDLQNDMVKEVTSETIDISHQLTYNISFNEIIKENRLDPEFYQPKYYNIIKYIQESKHGSSQLGELIHPIVNGLDERNYVVHGVPYIRVGDIKNGKINLEDAKKVSITQKEVSKDISLKEGDLLLTRKGSFGNSAVIKEREKDVIISSEIMRIRIKEEYKKVMLSEYLSLYLNSRLGYYQIERRVHGVAFYSISQKDLMKIEINIPPLNIQKRYVEELGEIEELSNKANNELENAINKVENLIESMI